MVTCHYSRSSICSSFARHSSVSSGLSQASQGSIRGRKIFESSVDSWYDIIVLLGSPDPRSIMSDVTSILNAMEHEDERTVRSLRKTC